MFRLGRGRLPTGVDRVMLAYLQRWREHACGVVLFGQWRRMLDAKTSDALFGLLLDAAPADKRWRVYRTMLKACLPPWPSQQAEGMRTFYLGHWGLERPGFSQWVRSTRQKPVYFIHDLIPLTHPEYCRPGEANLHAVRMQVALETGAGVLVNSQHTLDVLSDWAQKRGLKMPASAVAHLAPAALTPTSDLAGQSTVLQRPLQAHYFVVLGTIEPRKNHLLLLQLWRDLVAMKGKGAPHLVVIGQRGWECENVLDMLERCPGLREHVHELPHCTDKQLASYLAHAQALLFPSFTEGYGMPVVEALMVGTPVIASDLPVFREFAHNVPEWLYPNDGVGWLRAVQDYGDSHHPRRLAQLERLRQWNPPTWSQHFDAVDDLLERLP